MNDKLEELKAYFNLKFNGQEKKKQTKTFNNIIDDLKKQITVQIQNEVSDDVKKCVIYICHIHMTYDNFNLRSFKQNPNRHIKRGLFTMPINKSYKMRFSKLLVFSLEIAFLNSTFILYKGTSESLAKSKLTFPDYC